MTVPGGIEEFVSETHDEDILNHLLAQIMIDTEDLIFLPVRRQGLCESARALQVLAEWFFNLLQEHELVFFAGQEQRKKKSIYLLLITHNNTSDAFLRVAILLQMLRDGNKHARWQCHVEDPVPCISAML